jgi:hypothetical protein
VRDEQPKMASLALAKTITIDKLERIELTKASYAAERVEL